MDRVEPVGRGDEQDVRKIEGQVEVVVGKGVVLLRVEDFEQRGGGIAAKIRAYLVDFIQQNHRVVALDAAQALNDPAG